MKLYFARHGQTNWNLRDRIQGHADTPLNDTGIAQAKALQNWIKSHGLKFDAVYSSPLSRVLETAKIATDNQYNIIIDERLMERHAGQFEGRPCTELFDHEIDFLDLDLNTSDYGIEPIRDFVDRINDFLHSLAKNHPADAQIFIVSSSGIMKRSYIILTGDDNPPNFANGEIFEYEI